MSAVGLVDVGGTKLLAAVSLDGGPPALTVRVPTPPTAPIATLCEMLDGTRRGERFDAIALAVPGPFDRGAGRLVNPPGMSAAWHGLKLAEELTRRYGCPVTLENDANCAALAEALHGAGRGCQTVVYYTVSTGIGSGVVRDGRLATGRHDTEAGHQVLWPGWLGGPRCDCGGTGCLETLASGRAIARRAGVPADRCQDPGIWEDVGRWLGLAVVNATVLLDPDCVVFGGGVCASWSRFSATLRSTVSQALHLQPEPRIALAELGEDRNLWGALALLSA